jgi:flagellar biosynthetic protein FliR
MNIAITDQALLVAYWLTFTRWICVLTQLPLFDNGSIPNMVKVLATLLISFTFFPMVETQMYNEVIMYGSDHFFTLTAFNAVIGLTIGFLAKSIMSLFQAAGSLMTQQIGFTSISYFDPTFQQTSGPFEKVIQWTMIILILTSGALVPMFKGVIGSFSAISMTGMAKFSHAPEFYINSFKSMFMSAIMLASPLLFMNFLLNVVMGIIARTVPQMNILMVSFAVNIGLGLLVFVAISEEFFGVAFRIYMSKLSDWLLFIT